MQMTVWIENPRKHGCLWGESWLPSVGTVASDSSRAELRGPAGLERRLFPDWQRCLQELVLTNWGTLLEGPRFNKLKKKIPLQPQTLDTQSEWESFCSFCKIGKTARHLQMGLMCLRTVELSRPFWKPLPKDSKKWQWYTTSWMGSVSLTSEYSS